MTTLHKARADAWTKHDKLCAHNQRDIKDDLTALKASYDDISKQMNQVVRTKDLWDLAEMMQGKKPWKPS